MTTRPAHRSTIALRYCRWMLIAAWALVFAPFPATAQPSVGREDPGGFVPPSPSASASIQPVQSSNSSQVAVRGPCDPDYWIVSTRHCKFEVDCGQACNYHVIRFDGSNPRRTQCAGEGEFRRVQVTGVQWNRGFLLAADGVLGRNEIPTNVHPSLLRAVVHFLRRLRGG